MTVQPHTVRLAIPIDAAAEVAQTLRLLARQPWLVSGRDDDAIGAVLRNSEAIKSVLDRLGWLLVIERGFVRLVKPPPPRLSGWINEAPSPLVCSWFFALTAAAEGLPQQVTIGQFVEAGKMTAAEAGIPLTNNQSERRAIYHALKALTERGIVEATDGNLKSYLDDDDARVLLTIFHTRLLHVIANFDATNDPRINPEAWLDNVCHEPDFSRRMRRRLIDDTCLHTIELDDEEMDWLSRRLRGTDGGPLADAFGLTIERRAEGAAFIVPDDAFRWPKDLGEVPFPSKGIHTQVALLLSDIVAAEGEDSDGPGPGWLGMPRYRIVEALQTLAAGRTVGTGGWPAEYASDLGRLLSETEQLLFAVNLLRVVDDWWWLSPAMGRWEAPPNKEIATNFSLPAADLPNDPELSLFNLEGS